MQTITQRYPQGVVLPADNTRAVLEVYGGTVNGLPTPYKPRVVPTGELDIVGDSVVHTNQVPRMAEERWVARLDGATKYWVLDVPVEVPIGGSVELDLLYDPNTTIDNDYILCSETSTSTSSFFLSRETIGVGSSGVISEYTIDEQVSNNFPYDNSFHTIKYMFNSDLGRIKFLGTRFSIQQLSRGIFKNFRVRDSNGIVLNEVQLTNKDQGATQLATVGSINATMVNYTGDEWEQLP